METYSITGIDETLKGIIMADAGQQLFNSDSTIQPITIGKHKVSPWGSNNALPEEIRDNIEKSDIMATNLRFNRDVCYGLGPKLVDIIRDKNGKAVDYVDVHDEGPEQEFFERNDIPMFFLEQLTDMNYFHNAFSELMPEKASQKIFSISHKEAMFSRWSVMNSKGVIEYHYYSSKWKDSPAESDISASQVIDEFNAVLDIRAKLLNKKRMIFPVYMPSPGRPYYSRPDWYSLFESGWYDHSIAIPALKKAIMKNNLGVKFIIYISPNYWEELLKTTKIDKTDLEAVKKLKASEIQAMTEFLSGAESAAKAIVTIKQFLPIGNTAIEHKWIEIEAVKNDITGGEYISDIETVANIMSYAMGVHPSLIGATPGKNGSSMSGTDKRELFLMKQALMKPVVDRCLRPLQLIRSINDWKQDRVIVVPEYIFTTLDQNKSGKQESTNNKA